MCAVRMSIVAFSHSLAVNYQLAYCLMFCRWKKKRHWNSLEGQWFPMPGRFQILTGHSSPRSKKYLTTPQLIWPEHPWLIKWFISSCRSSKETTNARSPNLRVLQRRERRKMMVNAAASSAAASGMRWLVFLCRAEQRAAVQELLNHSFWF